MGSNKIPQRMCIACRTMKDKKELIRVVRTPDNNIIIDKTSKKPGRGCYVCDNKDCLAKAIKSHGIERSFGMKISKDVYDKLRDEVENDG